MELTAPHYLKSPYGLQEVKSLLTGFFFKVSQVPFSLDLKDIHKEELKISKCNRVLYIYREFFMGG